MSKPSYVETKKRLTRDKKQTADIKPGMVKIVLNVQYGGFSLSNKAFEELINLGMIASHRDKTKEDYNQDAEIFVETENVYDKKQKKVVEKKSYYFNYKKIDPDSVEFRKDERLIKVVEQLGNLSSTWLSTLKVIQVPENAKIYIDDYAGIEDIKLLKKKLTRKDRKRLKYVKTHIKDKG